MKRLPPIGLHLGIRDRSSWKLVSNLWLLRLVFIQEILILSFDANAGLLCSQYFTRGCANIFHPGCASKYPNSVLCSQYFIPGVQNVQMCIRQIPQQNLVTAASTPTLPAPLRRKCGGFGGVMVAAPRVLVIRQKGGLERRLGGWLVEEENFEELSCPWMLIIRKKKGGWCGRGRKKWGRRTWRSHRAPGVHFPPTCLTSYNMCSYGK